MTINPEFMRRIVEQGVGFDGSSVAGITTVDDSDRLLMPVPESYRVLEFNNERIGFCIAKILNLMGGRSQTDPRAVLENVLERAEAEFGVSFQVAPEHEFFSSKAITSPRTSTRTRPGIFTRTPRTRA